MSLSLVSGVSSFGLLSMSSLLDDLGVTASSFVWFWSTVMSLSLVSILLGSPGVLFWSSVMLLSWVVSVLISMTVVSVLIVTSVAVVSDLVSTSVAVVSDFEKSSPPLIASLEISIVVVVTSDLSVELGS